MRKKRVIVAGGGVGGLSAAIHARLAGHEVLLLEKSKLGGKAAQIGESGFILDPGPSIIILPRIYRDVFRRAGRDPDDYLNFNPLDPITRVFFEGKDFVDLPSGVDPCLRVAEQISKTDAASLKHLIDSLSHIAPHVDKSVFHEPINSFLQLLSPHLVAAGIHFSKVKSYKSYIDERFVSPMFRAFFYGFPSYGGQTYDSRAMGNLLIPYYMLTEGVFYPVGGVSAIPESFERLARELGVEIRTDTEVIGFDLKGDRINSVRIKGRGAETCDAVISNIDRLTTARDFLGQTATARPSLSYFTIHWGLRGELRRAVHHMLLIPNGYEKGFELLYRKRQFPDPPIVYLNVTSVSDPRVAPKGCTNLFAVISTPACEPDLDWSELIRSGRTKIKSALSERGWDFPDEEIIFERVQTPQYFESAHGNYLGSLYGPDESERLFGGMFPLRCKDERIKNLFYAGGSVQPGAGLPMVTLSGKFAADLLDRS